MAIDLQDFLCISFATWAVHRVALSQGGSTKARSKIERVQGWAAAEELQGWSPGIRNDLIHLIHDDSWWFMLNLCWFPRAFIILFLQSEMHIGAELGGQFAIRVGHLSTETVPMSTICLRKLWEVKLSMKALWLRLQVWFMCLEHCTTHIHETGRKAKLRVQSGRGVAMQHQFVHGCCFSLRLLVQAILGTEPWFPRESTWASLAVPSFNLVYGLCGPLFE